MARPGERLVEAESARACDTDRGEFWLSDPWTVGQTRNNLSAYEPNQVFINLGKMQFANASYVSSADSDGDGRGVVTADVNGDLQPDLIVRQSGGGPIIVYENRFPRAGRLEISFRGTKSNSRGIGARIVAEVGGRTIQRQLFPEYNFLVTQSTVLRLGVGDATSIDKLTVHWPSGTVQTFTNVKTGQHIRITEDQKLYVPLLTSTR